MLPADLYNAIHIVFCRFNEMVTWEIMRGANDKGPVIMNVQDSFPSDQLPRKTGRDVCCGCSYSPASNVLSQELFCHR